MFKIVNINKPQGWTSNDVVQKIKYDKKLYKEKVGHLGTLDPFATGVLPITIGKASRLFDYYLNKSKKYIALFEFGKTTDTLDIFGQVINTSDKIITKEDIKKALPKFIGNISQVPPIYSAKKVNGQKAYNIARAGGEVKLLPRNIQIYDFDLLDKNAKCIKKYAIIDEKMQKNVNFSQIYAFEITCSSGTYIRCLARDLAEEMGSCGYVVALTRIRSGCFDIEKSIELDDFLSGDFEQFKNGVWDANDVFADELIVDVDDRILRDFLDGKKPLLNFECDVDRNFVIRHKGIVVALCFGNSRKYDTLAFLYEGEG